MFLWNFYLNLSLKVRLAVLCICYSACIIASVLVFYFTPEILLRIGAITLFILLGGLFGWINIWSINRPLQQAMSQLQTMSQGDLSKLATVRHHNEFGSMLRSIGVLQQEMCNILSGARDAGLQMEQSSCQVAEISNDFAVTNVNQHQQFEAVSLAAGELRQISETVRDHAMSVREKSVQSENEAEQGLRAVNESIAMMHLTVQEVDAAARETAELKTVGETINRIVDSISEIADQTNLLALNAAIEAARAGEQGRGFAVVADQVRSLASRTALETEQITAIINQFGALVNKAIETMQRVELRVKQSEQKSEETALVIEHMTTVVRESSAVNLRISEVSQSQMERLLGLQDSLNSLSATIRENGNKVAVTATISSDLNKLARQLNGLMGRFKFENKHTAKSTGHEKRRYPRANNGLLVRLSDTSGGRTDGVSSDFSLCGMQMRLPASTSMSKGDIRQVDIFTPSTSVEEYKAQHPLQLEAHVRWVKPSADVLTCGVEFDQLNPSQKQRLQTCFEHFQKPSHYS